MILNAILILALCGSVAAELVTLAKLREEKEKRWDEISKRWDEISRAVTIENALEQSTAREKCSAEAVQWYADQLMDCERKRRAISKDARALQDKLSAILCPTNNHIWRDGVCTKCGREKQ